MRTRTPGLLAVIATAGVTLAVGTAATAASWSAPQYPRTTGAAAPPNAAYSQPMALAQSSNGAAALLYRGANKGIYAISRSSVTSKWGNPTTWLPASRANAGGALDAVMSGSRVWAMWTNFGNKRLLSMTGTRASGSGSTPRSTGLPVAGLPSVFELQGAGTRGYYGLTSAKTGAAYGGPVSAGRIPPYPEQVLATSSSGSSYSANAAGQQVALLFDGTSLAWSTRSAAVPWTPASTQGITPQLAIGYADAYAGQGSVPPSDIAVDADGNAAIAWIAYVDAQGALTANRASAAGAAVVISSRSGPGGAFGTPVMVARLPAPAGGGLSPVVSNLQVALSGGTTAVAWMTMGDTMGDGPPLLWVTSGVTNQALPAPSQLPDPLGLQDASYGPVSFALAVNARGMAAAAFGWGLTQGQEDGLFATVSAGPGQPWSALAEVSGCTKRPMGSDSGYGDMQLEPFTNGFTLAFACQGDPSGMTNPGAIGITTYR